MKENGTNAAEKSYPIKPITILVPYSAGSTPDVLARMLEKKSIQFLGQPLIVTNKPGGSGTIAWNELASSKADGYTIGVATTGVVLQSLYGQAKYNYPTAMEPLAKVTTTPIVMVVPSNSKWKNLSEFIAYAKAHPNAIKYGHGGLGTAVHVVAELFAQTAGIQMEQVPFQGGSEQIAALLGNHIDVAFLIQGNLKEYVKDGQLNVFAVAESHRLRDAEFSNVPTFKEQGLNVEFDNWQCIAAPKGLPISVKNKLVSGIKELINDVEFQANMREVGLAVEYLGPEDCIKGWALQNDHLGKVIQETGIAQRIVSQRK